MKEMLYFTAEWCNPCKRTKPFAEELIIDGMPIVFVDADESPELVQKFKVLSVPTFIMVEDGKEYSRMNGAKTKQQLEEFFNG